MTKTIKELKKAVADALVSVEDAVKAADDAYKVLWDVEGAYQKALKEVKND
jgi:hypothetical protein